jgi:hypothetical protein
VLLLSGVCFMTSDLSSNLSSRREHRHGGPEDSRLYRRRRVALDAV